MTPEGTDRRAPALAAGGDQVAAHDDAQQSRLRDQVSSAERAVLDVVSDSSESPTPTRVLERLARRRNGLTQSAGALAIQRLVASGRPRLTPLVRDPVRARAARLADLAQREVMGAFGNRRLTTVGAGFVAALISALNVFLLVQTVTG